MKKIVLSFFRISSFLLFVLTPKIHAKVLEQDSLALVAFYHSTNGDNWVNNGGWLKAPVSEWYGVRRIENERVKSLSLYDNNLNGTIPPELGDLTQLEHTLFYRNKLTGMIPVQIGNLTELRSLYLQENLLTGNIPFEIGNLLELKELYLDHNQFTGNIPDEIGNLKKLAALKLWENELEGAIPASIWGLTELVELDLCTNNLTGCIPSEIGNLVHLEMLYLCDNQLTGTIPVEIGNLVRLTTLYLGANQLSGEIPVELFNLTELERLVLSENQLTGQVPVEIKNLGYINYINIHHNQLSGTFPPLKDRPNSAVMRRLRINDNQFTGLPLFTRVSYLEIQNNKLTFEDIEPNISIPDFEYSPQDSVGEQQDTTVASGSSLTLSVSVGGSANHYQWKKNGIEIVGATDSVFNIASVTFSDAGTYNCQINNTIATELILYSRPIIVTIDSTSGVQSPLAGIPPEFVLEQNYPNPFNSSTTIRYLLPKSSHVFIVVYDVLGRDVAVLVDSKQQAGIHEITWDGKDLDGLELASGVYIFQLNTGSQIVSRKMLLSK